MNIEIKNVTIIGSGPAGLTAALYTARAELTPILIAGTTPGGQLMLTSEVENFPGFPEGIQGPDLMNRMIKQAQRFGTKMVNENVVSVDFTNKPFTVKTEKNEYKSKAVIIATGADAMWLGLENEARLRGKGVSACATCDGFFFKGQEVVIVGGGDAAMEEANFLTKFAAKVILIHRRDEFKASKIMVKRVKENPKIEIIMSVQVIDVLGKDKVEGVKIKYLETGEEKEIKIQGFFVAIGHAPNTKIFAKTGVEVDKKGYINVKDHTRTNIEGVFVAGDVNDYRYRQAVTAAGMGCAAALDVEKYLAEQEE